MVLTQMVFCHIIMQNPLHGQMIAPGMQLIQTSAGTQLVPYTMYNDELEGEGSDDNENVVDRSRSPSPPISGFTGAITK